MRAIWHAIAVVNQVRGAEGYPQLGAAGNWHADLYKSRLLGRMILHGRPPLDELPPFAMGARDYAAVDPEWWGVCDMCRPR